MSINSAPAAVSLTSKLATTPACVFQINAGINVAISGVTIDQRQPRQQWRRASATTGGTLTRERNTTISGYTRRIFGGGGIYNTLRGHTAAGTSEHHHR